MMSFVQRSVCSFLLLPTLGVAADPQTSQDASTQVMIALPLNAAETETRDAPRLRDTLRQPYGDDQESSKPYRLSAQERHRLREQLRSGAGGTSSGFVQSQK